MYDDPERGRHQPGSRQREHTDDYDFERRPRRKRLGLFTRLVRGAVTLMAGVALTFAAFYFLVGTPYDPFDRLLTRFISPAPFAPPTEPVEVADASLIGKQAEAWGVTNCLRAIVNVAGYLTQKTEYSYRLLRSERDANLELFSATIAAREPNSGVSGLSTFHAAPIHDGRCNVAMQTTMYFPQPCARVKQNRFPNFSQIEFGDVAAAFASLRGNTSVYLLPAGEAGCVVTTTESIY